MDKPQYERRREQLRTDLAGAQKEYETAALLGAADLDDHRAEVSAFQTAIADLDAAWRAAERQQSAEGHLNEAKRLEAELSARLSHIESAVRVAAEIEERLKHLRASFSQLGSHVSQLPADPSLFAADEVERALADVYGAFVGAGMPAYPVAPAVADRGAKLRDRLKRTLAAQIDALRAGSPHG